MYTERVCIFSNPKVRAIVFSINKAMKSMVLIFILMVLFLILFGLLIYTLFNDIGEDSSNIEYSFDQFRTWYEDRQFFDEVLELFQNLNLENRFQKRKGFGGFISFGWTFAILMQIMTLDRWKGIIDQVHYDAFKNGSKIIYTTLLTVAYSRSTVGLQ